MPATGSWIEINAHITDVNEIHDVTINITSDYATSQEDLEFIFDHIHDSEFNVDTSFIADIPSRSMVNYTVEILAKSISRDSNSE